MGDPDSSEIQVRNSKICSSAKHHTNNNITEKTNNCLSSTPTANLVANVLFQQYFT
jgi:hypothetical protein